MDDVQKIENAADESQKQQETDVSGAPSGGDDAALSVSNGETQTVGVDTGVTRDVLAELSDMTAERDALQVKLEASDKALADLQAELVKAKAKPKASAAAKPAKARKLEPVDHGLSSGELIELIKGADHVVVAFSDGKREIAGLEPLLIEGDAWAVTAAGLSLRLPQLRVFGPAGLAAPYQLHGYALLIDGELVAYSRRVEVLAINANSEIDLTNDVVF